jgi:hypothetical protein
MYPRTETPRQDASTDESRPLLHRVFGHTEADRDEDQYQPEDTVDGRVADQTELEDRTELEDQGDANEQAAADREAVDDELRDDTDAPHADAPHGDYEPAAFDESTRPDPTVEAPGDAEPAVVPHTAEPSDFDEPTDLDEPTSVDEPTDLKPGDAPVAPVTAIWPDDSARDFRDRWREAQLSFVDDPQKAADDTRALVNEAVEALTAALSSHREQFDSWPDNPDTEQYRVVVQRYRTFFERLLAL